MNAHFSRPRTKARMPALEVAALAGMVVCTPAFADLSPALDRVSISAGAFLADPTFNLGVNTPYGNLQSGDIAMGKETMPRIKADVIIFDSQGLSLDMFQYNRTYTGSISNNSNINGNQLTTFGNASFGLKIDYAKLGYKWWFGSGNTVVGLGAGAAYYKITLNASAFASINNASTGISGGYSDDAVAPILEIGVRHAISPDLRLFADASGVTKSSGALSGEIYNAALGVEWFPAKNVGLGLDYSMSQIELRRQDTVSENIKVKFQGPSAFVKVRF